jgi:hypothetical protein
MTRIDTLRAIAAAVRASHARALFAVAWLALHIDTERLGELLEALADHDQGDELIGHIERAQRLSAERWSGSSRLD